jgi:hypothetical protein
MKRINRSLWEGRIELWTPPGSSTPRVQPAGEK